jgi:exosortase family protein XrtF
MPMNKAFIQFLAATIGLYLVWFGLYEFVLKPNGRLDHLISENITIITCYFLNLMDYEAHYTIARKLGETYLFLGNNIMPTVKIGASCNGLEMLMIFNIFIICYPGNPVIKALFIIGGDLLIHGLNILRNFVLTLLTMHRSVYFDLFHRYVFIFLIYGFIFILWMWWANKLSKFNPGIEKAN